jgi:hypothetical protein
MLANRSSNLAIHPCNLANHPSSLAIHPPSPKRFNIAIIATSSPSLSLSCFCVLQVEPIPMTYFLIRVEAVEARETESPMNNKSRNLSENNFERITQPLH